MTTITQYANWCPHYGGAPIFTHQGISFYGAQVSRAYEFDGVVVALAPYSGGTTLEVPEGYEGLTEFAVNQRVIRVGWPDMHIPALDVAFWHALLNELAAKRERHVLFCCAGGHGRTGTALAAMAIVAKGWNIARAVAQIRKRYCDEAVETTSQVGYLRAVDLWARKAGIVKGQIPKNMPKGSAFLPVSGVFPTPATSAFATDEPDPRDVAEWVGAKGPDPALAQDLEWEEND